MTPPCTDHCDWRHLYSQHHSSTAASAVITSDKGGGKCFRPCLSVCLSVSKITQKRVHGFGWNVACRQMSGHGAWRNWLTFEPDPDYSPDAGTGLLSSTSYKRCNADFYYVGENPTCMYRPPVAEARRGFKMVLFTASRGNIFVGGICALPSALLVRAAKSTAKITNWILTPQRVSTFANSFLRKACHYAIS